MPNLLTLPEHSRRSPRLTSSPHALRGSLSCTKGGVLTFAGPLEATFEAGDFDAIQCHDDDVAAILTILRDGRPDVAGRKRRVLRASAT